jgi:hypothetical protein
MNVQAIINAVVSQGGFDTDAVDTSRSVILEWVQTRYDQALSASEWRKVALELGPTVAGQAAYALPSRVIALKRLRVNGSRPWLQLSGEQLWEVQAGNGYLSGAPGAYALVFESDADQDVALWPVPEQAGLSIDTLAVVTDSTPLIDASSGAGSTPGLPDDLHRPLLVKGAIAEGLTTVEKRADLAAPFDAEFAEAAKALKRRAKSRLNSGPWQAAVGN